jgi:uncharacterized protein YdhG (YjbR/CyaY superfamily)
MAKTDFRSVDEYLATLPDDVRSVLQHVRRIIQKALPGADEVISYQIPAFKLSGSAVLYLAGWKAHYSLYPITAGLVAAFGDELEPYAASKGTLRFSLSEPIPAKLIERIAKLRAKETAERVAAKAVRSKKKLAPRKPGAKPALAKKKAARPAAKKVLRSSR